MKVKSILLLAIVFNDHENSFLDGLSKEATSINFLH